MTEYRICSNNGGKFFTVQRKWFWWWSDERHLDDVLYPDHGIDMPMALLTTFTSINEAREYILNRTNSAGVQVIECWHGS